jgi:quinol monooxygenase YgiN
VISRTIQLTVHPEAVDDALAAIRTLLATGPGTRGTVRGEVWQHALYPNTFMQLVQFTDTGAADAYMSSRAYEQFVAELAPLCVTPPAAEEWTPIDALN